MKNLQKLGIAFLVLLGTVLLASCGSNSAGTADEKLSTGISSSTKSADFGKPASAEAVKAMSAKLGAYFNGKNASNPQALTGSADSTGYKSATASVNTASTATPMIASSNVASPVFRFYNTKTGAHFFTMSAAESDYVKTTFPFFTFEGNSFFAYPDADPTLSPVYRFYNKVTGTHFFTISPEEKAYVQATWPDIFNFEGISWYASNATQSGWVPVYRFFNSKTSTHFYTTSVAERDYVQATWSWFTFEGIAYYVKQDADCTAAPIDSSGYSLVFKGCSAPNVAEYYDKTECVRDNATGLIWQGQTPAGSGVRANDAYKTNYDSTTSKQRFDTLVFGNYRAPTREEIDADTNSIGFKNAINASRLCGYGNWRLPTFVELIGLGKRDETPSINNEWFPNTRAGYYWTSTISPYVDVYVEIIDFRGAYGLNSGRNGANGGELPSVITVRLVR